MNTEQNWLVRKFLWYKALSNLWFVGAIWLYFYRLFITDQQVGMLDGVAFAIGLLAEVPSGALADKFGRDRLVRLGQILAGSGLLIQAAGSSFAPLFIGQSIMMIGVSFVSGADEALFFERLKFSRDSANWKRLLTRGAQAALLGTVLAMVVGGWLHTINPRVPWILNGIAFILSAAAVWGVADTRPRLARQKFMPELKAYLLDIRTGFGQFRRPALRLYVPLIITVQGLFYTTGYGLLRLVLLDRFRFSPVWGALVIALSSLITVGLLALMHKHADRLSEKRAVTYVSLAAAAGLLLSLADVGVWGFVVLLILYAGEHLMHPFMSNILNYHAPDKQRATVLSVASFFKTLPYIALAPIIGFLNGRGQLHYFMVAWALLIIAALGQYLLIKRRDSIIVTPDS